MAHIICLMDNTALVVGLNGSYLFIHKVFLYSELSFEERKML